MSVSSELTASLPSMTGEKAEPDTGMIAEEVTCRRRVLDSKQRFGVYHLQVVIDMHDHIKVLERCGRISEATDLRRQALDILRCLDLVTSAGSF